MGSDEMGVEPIWPIDALYAIDGSIGEGGTE